MKRPFRWDWVVVIIGFLALGAVAHFGVFGRAVAVACGYALGRWDSEFGVKYRMPR